MSLLEAYAQTAFDPCLIVIGAISGLGDRQGISKHMREQRKVIHSFNIIFACSYEKQYEW